MQTEQIFLSLESLSITERDALKKHLGEGGVPHLGMLSKMCRMGLLEPDPNTGYRPCEGVRDAAGRFFERRYASAVAAVMQGEE